MARGGMLKLRFDWYINGSLAKLHCINNDKCFFCLINVKTDEWTSSRTNKTPRRAVELFKSIKPLVFFVFILVKNRMLTNMGSIVTTHVLILFLAVFSRTLKQEQKRISSRSALHHCSREGKGGGGGRGDWVVSHVPSMSGVTVFN